MNAKQKRFCECYARCGSGTTAAIEAGYSERSARYIASRLLANVDISEYISELQSEIRSKEIASIHEVKKFWSDVMNDESQKMTYRLSASNLLAKSSGAFLEQPNVVINNDTDDTRVHIYLPEIMSEEDCELRGDDS